MDKKFPSLATCIKACEKDMGVMVPLKCTCKYHNTVAERDEQGNIYIQCRGCKEKVKIEPIKEPMKNGKSGMANSN